MIYQPRAGQVAFERDLDRHRVCAFLTRRQYGKTTNAARIALKKMMRTKGHTVIFGSVKLDLGREIVRKESEAMTRAFVAALDDAGVPWSAVAGDRATRLDRALDVVGEVLGRPRFPDDPDPTTRPTNGATRP